MMTANDEGSNSIQLASIFMWKRICSARTFAGQTRSHGKSASLLRNGRHGASIRRIPQWPNLMRWLLLLLLTQGALSACSHAAVTVTLRDQRFTVEIADDYDERMRGLMYRDQMAADAGMLFLFEQQGPQAFWMKNTKIPLDILYFDNAWALVGWSLNTPPCSLGDRCPSYPSQAPARYVLELNAGTAERIGAKLGDRLTVEGLSE